ncbi:uncharacterized protein LOC143191805 isoform X3 [Rhynchophorus ferrugineus]|uniref:uncharacterized protein LOC143191805 isoform X3 n=1 Tax=Rhynchophorus ferrugineus TaxID=354439 RepID=UPI003FCDA199
MDSVKLLCVVLVFRVLAASGDELLLRSTHRLKAIEITSCETDIDCEDIENGTCENFMCSCGNTRNCVNKNKVMVTKIGENCTTVDDCNIEGSLCINGKCACHKGNVASQDQRTCLKIATGLGSTCKDRVQCQAAVSHSTCQNDKCDCEEQMHQYNGSCYRNVGLGKDCEQQGECSAVTFAECVAGVCVCRDGYVRSLKSEKCLAIAAKIDAPCYEDVQCSTRFGKAICKTGHCQCEELYNFKQSRNVCVRDMPDYSFR